MAKVTSLTVNGKKLPVDVDSTVSLLSVLRNDLDLTGSKYGCGEGQCGACTVLIDGQPMRSCITQVGRAAGKQIVTIEGLEKEGKLHPLQEAFIKADAMQCAYCTSGMIMSATALLAKNPKPSHADIVTGMNGNICRCGTYEGMLFGKVVRPATFNATLVSSDTKAAEAMTGVKVVTDGNFIGVVAPDQQTATKAANVIATDWKSAAQPSNAELFDVLRKPATN